MISPRGQLSRRPTTGGSLCGGWEGGRNADTTAAEGGERKSVCERRGSSVPPECAPVTEGEQIKDEKFYNDLPKQVIFD